MTSEERQTVTAIVDGYLDLLKVQNDTMTVQNDTMTERQIVIAVVDGYLDLLKVHNDAMTEGEGEKNAHLAQQDAYVERMTLVHGQELVDAAGDRLAMLLEGEC